MTAGIGIDLVEVARIEKILQKWGDLFLKRVYTEKEIDYCRQRGRPDIHFAARFAVKEAFLKAMGIGLGMGVHLRDIETINNAAGRPFIQLNEKLKMLLAKRDVENVQVSITHTRGHAAAIVMVECPATRLGKCLTTKTEEHAAKI